MPKPLASLSLDLDNRWSYMKTHGDAGWETFPSYFDIVVPRFLEFLEKRKLRMTVFVVGQDAEIEANRAALQSIPAAGHEIGNHSFHHEPWLHLYEEEQLRAEIARTADALESVCGVRPRGFRGPGFSYSPTLLRVLMDEGYEYEASTFPTFIGPLARMYYFFSSRLNREQRLERKLLFGSLREGFRPIKPYAWRDGDRQLIELPVTTMPLFRAPFHLSYILYLGSYSKAIAKAYFNTALTLCRATGTEPSLLLHPLDFLGSDDGVGLDFFPAMNMSADYKLKLVGEIIDMLAATYDVVTMREHIAAAAKRRLREVDLALPSRKRAAQHPAPTIRNTASAAEDSAVDVPA